MNYIKDIELKTNNLYNAIIEIPKKTKNKYELEDGTFEKIVKVRKVKCKYPFYYGCFPQTLAGDNDPLDMILISAKKRKILDIVTVIPLGIIRTLDCGEIDDKVIVIPYDEPLKKLEKEKEEVLKFLHKYKGKKANTIIDDELYNSDYARKIIEHAHQVYKDKRPHLETYPKFEKKLEDGTTEEKMKEETTETIKKKSPIF